MRLIDADALIEVMEERKKIWLSKCEYNDAIREVKEAPTVEAYIFEQVQDLVALNKKLSEERPHGEWIECEDKRYCECSNCWVLVTKKEAEDFGYCPNCGSDNRPKEGE